MATLTETAYYSKKIFKYGFLMLVLLLALKFGWGLFVTYWKTSHPEPPPPPEARFGIIPKIKFPDNPSSLPKLSYQLQTIEGSPPNLPNIANVYFMPQSGPNLLAVDRAKQRAKKIGFDQEPTRLSATFYRWEGRTNPPSTLELDIISGKFKMSYPYLQDESLPINGGPSQQNAIASAKAFLTGFDTLPNDLADDRTSIQSLKFSNQDLIPAIAIADTQMMRVNFYRANLAELPIFPPDPKISLISFLVSNSQDPRKKIVDANFTYHQIERQTASTYPLKSAAQAWEELQAGQGFVASLGSNQNGNIAIRRIYLAYFESEEPQKFLQPIFIFEGDNGFYAYVSALTASVTE